MDIYNNSTNLPVDTLILMKTVKIKLIVSYNLKIHMFTDRVSKYE